MTSIFAKFVLICFISFAFCDSYGRSSYDSDYNYNSGKSNYNGNSLYMNKPLYSTYHSQVNRPYTGSAGLAPYQNSLYGSNSHYYTSGYSTNYNNKPNLQQYLNPNNNNYLEQITPPLPLYNNKDYSNDVSSYGNLLYPYNNAVQNNQYSQYPVAPSYDSAPYASSAHFCIPVCPNSYDYAPMYANQYQYALPYSASNPLLQTYSVPTESEINPLKKYTQGTITFFLI